MVELALPESSMQQQNKEEEAESAEISDCDACPSEPKGPNAQNVDRRGTTTTGKSSKDTAAARYSQSDKPRQRATLEKNLSDNYGVKTTHVSETAGAGERYNTLQRLGDDGSSEFSLYTLLGDRELSNMSQVFFIACRFSK